MKKILFIFAIIVTGFVLSSFGKNEQKNNVGNDWIYYGQITSWRATTESRTIYIWYKEGNGVRRYGASTDRNGRPDTMFGLGTVYLNPLYKSTECTDFRRNYRYAADCCDFFNANLPYMEKR